MNRRQAMALLAALVAAGISPPSFVAYDDYAEWPSVTGSLLARGYSREDVAKVAGGNFLRLFGDVTST
jgi:microsomal dipeptidase-like Zn-dependent dipeptidase